MQDFLNLAEFVLMDIGSFMKTGAVGPLHISAIGLMLVFLRLRIGKKKHGSAFEPFQAGIAPANNHASGRFFEKRRLPTLKSCPNCAEQVPLFALLCESCDYNFLAERPGRGQKLLPPPQEISEPEKPVYELTVVHREDLPSV